MTIDIEEYNKIKANVEKLQKDVNRSEGVLASCLERLKELGYSSIEEAEKGLLKIEEEYKKAQQEYNTQLKEFKEKWGDLLRI